MPMIADREISRELVQSGQAAYRIITHDVLPFIRSGCGIRRLEILDESRILAGELDAYMLDFVMRIVDDQTGLRGSLFINAGRAVLVGSGILWVDSFKLWIQLLEASEHLIEGMVFQNQ